jgi:hypothetical protein
LSERRIEYLEKFVGVSAKPKAEEDFSETIEFDN